MNSPNIFSLFLITIFFGINSIHAKVIYVDSTATSGNSSGSTWANSYLDLQTALSSALSGDQIWVAEGVYYPDEGAGQVDNDNNSSFIMKSGVALYGGFPTGGGDGTFQARNQETHLTILSGDLLQNDIDGQNVFDNARHVVDGSSTDALSLLDGFTITAGRASGPAPSGYGGGLYMLNGSPVIRNCLFTGNSASFDGAAVYASSSSPTITGCQFTRNTAFRGGAIYFSGSTPSISNCNFDLNKSSGYGGAIMATSWSDLNISNSTFAGNESGSAGAINLHLYSGATITNSTFSGNLAKGNPYYGGGAIYTSQFASLSLINCTVSGNMSLSRYGSAAIEHTSSEAIDLTNCIIWNNRAPNIINEKTDSFRSSATNVTFRNCLIEHYSDTELNDGDGSNNLDGTNNNQAPIFYSSVPTHSAPTTHGDLRLRMLSPGIDRGYNMANNLPLDLAGSPRIANFYNSEESTIDLGAFEHPPLPAPKRVIYVDSSAAAGGLADGTSWPNAFLDLQSALMVAGRGDSIWVAQGTYYPDIGPGQVNDDRLSTFLLNQDIQLLGGFPSHGGDATIHARSPSVYLTVLSGDLAQDDESGGDKSENSYHVMTVSAGKVPQIDGFTISGGNANGISPHNIAGGLFQEGGSPHVKHCVFSNNSAQHGGAVVNTPGGSPWYEECLFANNSSIFTAGAMVNFGDSTPVIETCTFLDNDAGQIGGAVINSPNSATSILGSVFKNNESLVGGALGNSSSSVYVSESSFLSNTSNVGGAVHSEGSTASYINCRFSGNMSNFNGGAMLHTNCPKINIANCLFSGNKSASEGGSIHNDASSLDVVNCTFSGNWAAVGSVMVNVNNSTANLTNSIVWNNRYDAVASIYPFEKDVSTVRYYCCLVEYSGGSSNWDNQLGVDDGRNIDTNPLFVTPVNFQNAPTLQGDLRLAQGSPALNAGDGNFLSSVNNTLVDLIGALRHFHAIDLGAYEGGYTAFATLYPSISTTGDENNNGKTNYEDYAFGFDPLDPSVSYESPVLKDGKITFENRMHATDAHVQYLKSSNMTDWYTMVEGIDYIIESKQTHGVQPRLTTVLKLLNLPPITQAVFIRQRISTTP